MKELKYLVRPNIWALTPYSSARNEYAGKEASTFLDANENPFNNPFNRYPDPLQLNLKQEIAKVKNVKPEQIFLGNGSDEAIDLVFRVFCNPQIDNVVSINPTYGMYEVSAAINNVEYRALKLNGNFEFKADDLLNLTNNHTKVIFLCSPNNPTGNLLPREEIITVLKTFEGIVVIDEAYSDFSPEPEFRKMLNEFPNMIILNTFSKAWGNAGIRLGMAFATPSIISILNNVKYPYNINILTQEKAIEILKDRIKVEKWIKLIIEEKARLKQSLIMLPYCKKLYPSQANFILMKVDDAQSLYNYLLNNGIVVRNRNNITLCENCLRITVGSTNDNNLLLSSLRKY